MQDWGSVVEGGMGAAMVGIGHCGRIVWVGGGLLKQWGGCVTRPSVG